MLLVCTILAAILKELLYVVRFEFQMPTSGAD